MLTFDPVEHRYSWHGKPVPNVTRVIRDLCDYSRIPPAVLENARDEGNALHKLVELDCAGDLDIESLPEWLKPRLDAWKLFLRDTGFRVIGSERRVFHPIFRYAGTSDLLGEWESGYALLDVKRTLFQGDVIGLQTAAYADAEEKNGLGGERVKRRGALLLLPNGKYKIELYEDRNDFGVFLACLTRFQWKEQHQ